MNKQINSTLSKVFIIIAVSYLFVFSELSAKDLKWQDVTLTTTWDIDTNLYGPKGEKQRNNPIKSFKIPKSHIKKILENLKNLYNNYPKIFLCLDSICTNNHTTCAACMSKGISKKNKHILREYNVLDKDDKVYQPIKKLTQIAYTIVNGKVKVKTLEEKDIENCSMTPSKVRNVLENIKTLSQNHPEVSLCFYLRCTNSHSTCPYCNSKNKQILRKYCMLNVNNKTCPLVKELMQIAYKFVNGKAKFKTLEELIKEGKITKKAGILQ